MNASGSCCEQEGIRESCGIEESGEPLSGGVSSPVGASGFSARQQEDVERLRRKIFEADQQFVESSTTYLAEVLFFSSCCFAYS